MCSNKSLCHLFVALNVFTASVFAQDYSNSSSTFAYMREGRGGGHNFFQLDEEMQLERMLRDALGGLNTSSAAPKGNRQKRFIHYDYSDHAVNLGLEFSVHFMSIPVKKTLDTAMGFLEVLPKTTINLNALFIGILFAVVGVVANGLLDVSAAGNPWQTFRSSMQSMMGGGAASTEGSDEAV